MPRRWRHPVAVAITGLALVVGASCACSSAPAAPPRVANAPAVPARVSNPPAGPARVAVASRPDASGGPARLTPPEIAGFRLKEAPSTYGPDTLYEFIDGAADAFLAFDLEELTALSYVHPSKAEVSVEVYRHRDAERAYGAYAMERSPGAAPLPIGIEGHGGRDYLQFVLGAYYVKLALADSKDVALLRAVADGVAGVLRGTREPPPVLKCFPSAGRVPRAEKFAARDFLGRAFLHDAVAVPYELGGSRFRLFAVRGRDDVDARDMIARYLAVSGSGAGDRRTPPNASGATTVSDPVNGRVILHWKGRWVWGAVDNPPASSAPLVDQLGAMLTGERGLQRSEPLQRVLARGGVAPPTLRR